MASKGAGPPPPAYGSDIASPQPAHVGPVQSVQGSDNYNASPYQNEAQRYPQQNYQNQAQGYPQQNYQNGSQNGHYQPGPQMGYQQQQQYGTWIWSWAG